MVVTDEWIRNNTTLANGWKAVQLKALGVDWPPRKGWKQRVIGMTITTEQQEIFERHAGRNNPRLI